MHQSRYRRILIHFARTLTVMLFWDIVLPGLGFRKFASKKRTERYVRAARQFRMLAVEMGGVLIKIGQFLSVRVDMLPAAVTDELSGLQDLVPPEDFSKVQALAEKELGGSLESLFESFEQQPLASASLGQVHQARLLTPEEGIPIRDVVVKIQRPQIEEIIQIDLAAIRVVIGWLHKYRPIRRRADLPALLEEFSRVLGEEIDYLNEGQNADAFWELFRQSQKIKIPRVIWSRTTRRVLTLEDVYAIKITDYAAIKGSGVDPGQVARRLFDCYLEQIFEHEVFHADPHPGNLFVIPPEEDTGTDWTLAFVDFGMVGRIPPSAREGLREGLIAVGTRDPSRLIQAYDKLGFLLPGADLAALEEAEGKAFERFWGKSMEELRQIDYRELMEFAYEFRDLMFEMPFQIPQDLLLLGRMLAILSGMCTGLDPEFNIWNRVKPYAESLVRREISGDGDVWWNEIETLLRSLLSMPARMGKLIDRLEGGELAVKAPELDDRLAGIQKNLQGLSGAVVFAALFIGGTQLLLAGYSLPGGLLLICSIVPLLILLLR